MRTARVSRPRKTPVNLRSDSFSLSHAKTYLGRLIQKAGEGKPVYIIRGQKRFLLQEVHPIEPIPMRPPGYFADSQTPEETRELNRLAKASSIRPPRDVE